jgi:hypothetical protein
VPELRRPPEASTHQLIDDRRRIFQARGGGPASVRRATECDARPKGAERRYRVVREQAGWVSLGPILLDAPL